MRNTVLLIAVVASGCGKKDDASGKAEPASANKAPEKPADKAPAAASHQCTFEITGGTTLTIAGEGGPANVMTNYWFKAGDKNLENWKPDDAQMVLNCNGEGDTSLSFSTKDLKKSQFPLAPQKFEVGDKGLMSVVGRIGSVSIHKVTGTVDVTAFDTSHVAGKVDLAAELIPGDKAVKITGTFDFKCPSMFSGCGL